MANQKNKPETQNAPVATFRLGLVKACVWQNEASNGIRHNVSFSRLYKKEDKWLETPSFGRDDLPLLIKVADQAHTFIFTQASSPTES